MRVLIVDDHEVVRTGVRSLLAASDRFSICGEASDRRDAIEARELKPDVITMDERLVAAAKIGHSGAFDDLYKRHAEKMFRITYRITRNREDAEDALQECFLSAFLQLKNFDGRSRFSTWLTRIAINAALMKLRKNHMYREVPIDQSTATSELRSERQLVDSSPNPEEHCTKSEREAILRDAIAKLRPRIRKAVEIHKLQERSLEETAQVLGTSVAAAKGCVFHARAALRKAPQLRFVVSSILGKSPGSSTRG